MADTPLLECRAVSKAFGAVQALFRVDFEVRNGEVMALVTEHALGDLDDAWRITTPDSPIPYSPPLEDAFLPGPERIAGEVLARP